MSYQIFFAAIDTQGRTLMRMPLVSHSRKPVYSMTIRKYIAELVVSLQDLDDRGVSPPLLGPVALQVGGRQAAPEAAVPPRQNFILLFVERGRGGLFGDDAAAVVELEFVGGAFPSTMRWRCEGARRGHEVG